MSIFNLNQRIRIKDDIANSEKYRNVPFGVNDQMRDLAGQEGIIKTAIEDWYAIENFSEHFQLDGTKYTISCDNERWNWPSCLLESVESNEESDETVVKQQPKLLSIILRWR